MAPQWIPWLYQYGVGGLIFFGALALVLRAKALPLENPANRRLLAALIIGYVGLLAVHGLWIAAVL